MTHMTYFRNDISIKQTANAFWLFASSVAYTNEVIYTVLLKTSDCSKRSIFSLFSPFSTRFLSFTRLRDQRSDRASKREIEVARLGLEKVGEKWSGGREKGGEMQRKGKEKKKRKEKKRNA